MGDRDTVITYSAATRQLQALGSVKDDTDKTPLMKMTYSSTDDLEWDLETEKLKEYMKGCALL